MFVALAGDIIGSVFKGISSYSCGNGSAHACRPDRLGLSYPAEVSRAPRHCAGTIPEACCKHMPPEISSAVFNCLPKHLEPIALQFRDRHCRYDGLPRPVDCL